ncbi:Ryanodine receptor Ryr [Thiohalocapsa marina]|uniref:Ryanodine receptor Ryr n=1 Tax=Thiohalocapsa marina TaxID=424902 RepID=A0A5M8FF40_9GAMM|nr:RyR domain-containing protein [Thiohalocapsa marina]KAA6183317.1 Ryanodine receptor Ryr [Thiohalocapsa marina]
MAVDDNAPAAAWLEVLGRRLRPSPLLLLCGQGALADAVADSLRRDGRRVRRMQAVDPAGSALRRVDILLLAGVTDIQRELARIADALQGARRRPRVLVLEDGREPLADAVRAAGLPVEILRLQRLAARVLLRRWPLHYACDPLFDQPVHLLLAGRTPLAEALLEQALRLGHYGDRPPTLTLLDDRPAAWRADVEARLPQAPAFSRLRFGPLDPPGPTSPPWLPDLPDRPNPPDLPAAVPVTGVFVLVEPPARGLQVAERLVATIASAHGVSPPVLLEVGDAELAGRLSDWDGQIIPFSYRRLALEAATLLDARDDRLARVVHAHYRDTTLAQGRDPAGEPSARPWETLAESYRDANRQQADHLWAKLAVTDCRAVPEELVESFAFAPSEVERLAMIEHARWAADRYLDGWQYAPERDNRRKHHPQLIPYAELSAPMKDLDRFAVRLVPTLLARSGLGLVRMLIVGMAPMSLAPAPGPAPVSAPEAASAPDPAPADTRLRPLFERVLRRLRARYPDRGLVIASTLADAPSRLLAQRALDAHDAGLILLCPWPLPALLAAQPDAAAQRAVLSLIERAERRVLLAGGQELQRWLDTRSQVQIDCTWAATAAAGKGQGKRVRVDPKRGLSWNFEY